MSKQSMHETTAKLLEDMLRRVRAGELEKFSIQYGNHYEIPPRNVFYIELDFGLLPPDPDDEQRTLSAPPNVAAQIRELLEQAKRDMVSEVLEMIRKGRVP